MGIGAPPPHQLPTALLRTALQVRRSWGAAVALRGRSWDAEWTQCGCTGMQLRRKSDAAGTQLNLGRGWDAAGTQLGRSWGFAFQYLAKHW
eukprot:gene10180-biopygen2224